MKKLLMVVLAGVGMTTFADKVYTLPDGAIREYKGELINNNSSAPTTVLEGANFDDYTILGSIINGGTTTYTHHSRWHGVAKPDWYEDIQNNDRTERLVQFWNSCEGNGWGGGFVFSTEARFFQDGSDVKAYLHGAACGDESGNKKATLNGKETNVYIMRNDSSTIWPGSCRLRADYVTRGLDYAADGIVYNVGWQNAAKVNGHVAIDHIAFRNKEYDDYWETVDESLIDAGKIAAGTGLNLEIPMAVAFPGKVKIENEIHSGLGANVKISGIPHNASIEGGLFSEGGTITLEGASNYDLEVGELNMKSRAADDLNYDIICDGYAYSTVFTNANILAVTNVYAQVQANHRWQYNDTKICHIRRPDADSLSFQIHYLSDGFIRCLMVLMHQKGNDIEVKHNGARSCVPNEEWGQVFGEVDFEALSPGKNPDPGYWALDCESRTVNGAGLRYLKLYMDSALAPDVDLALNSPFISSNATLVLKGSTAPDARKLKVKLGRNDTTQLDDLPARGFTIVDTNAELYIDRTIGFQSYYGTKAGYIKVQNGGQLFVGRNNGLGPQCIPVEVAPGGILNFGLPGIGTFMQYLKWLRLSGGLVQGKKPEMRTDGSAQIDVVGSQPSQMTCGLIIGTDVVKTNFFFVTDVTGDDGVDFSFSGGLTRLNQAATSSWVMKNCAGTMLYTGAFDITSPLIIANGKFILGDSDTMDADHGVIVEYKGCLGIGENVATTIGTVTFASRTPADTSLVEQERFGQVGIDFGSGATLEIENAVFDGAERILVTGDFDETSLKIGTSLTAEQLDCFRWGPEGRWRVIQDANGYIVPKTNGTTILLL